MGLFVIYLASGHQNPVLIGDNNLDIEENSLSGSPQVHFLRKSACCPVVVISLITSLNMVKGMAQSLSI